MVLGKVGGRLDFGLWTMPSGVDAEAYRLRVHVLGPMSGFVAEDMAAGGKVAGRGWGPQG